MAAADNPAERAGAATAHPDAAEPAGRRTPDGREGTDTPAGQEPGTSGQGPAGPPPADTGRRIEGRTPPRRKG